MRTMMILTAFLVLLFAVSCTEKSDKLTEVDIHSLKVPQNFDYEMTSMVEVSLQGAYRLPVTISAQDGKVLYRGMMNPATGLHTKLNLAKANKRLVVSYHVQEVLLNVTTNGINHNFSGN